MTEISANSAKSSRREPPSTGGFHMFRSFDAAQLRFGLWPVDTGKGQVAKGTVFVFGGRTDFIEKFYEDIHLFQARGYSCAALDWRGQGLSHRVHADRDRHYILDFEDHQQDLKAFLSLPEIENLPRPWIFFGHSAGAHNMLRFLHDNQGVVDKAVVMAPMVAINHMGIPRPIVLAIPKLMVKLGKGHHYAPGHQAFNEGRTGWRFKLTHDPERFSDEDYFIAENPALAVGGVTYRWFVEAEKSIARINAPNYAEAIKTPVLFLQAAEDKVVSNKAMTAFAKRVPHVGLVRIAGAKHELFKETDACRAAMWQAIDHFLG